MFLFCWLCCCCVLFLFFSFISLKCFNTTGTLILLIWCAVCARGSVRIHSGDTQPKCEAGAWNRTVFTMATPERMHWIEMLFLSYSHAYTIYMCCIIHRLLLCIRWVRDRKTSRIQGESVARLSAVVATPVQFDETGTIQSRTHQTKSKKEQKKKTLRK